MSKKTEPTVYELQKENEALRVQLQARILWQKSNEDGSTLRTDPTAYKPFERIVSAEYKFDHEGKITHQYKFDDNEALADIMKENPFLAYKEPEPAPKTDSLSPAQMATMTSEELWAAAALESET